MSFPLKSPFILRSVDIQNCQEDTKNQSIPLGFNFNRVHTILSRIEMKGYNKEMKKYLLLSVGIVVVLALLWWYFFYRDIRITVSPLSKDGVLNIEKPLDKYTFENLKKRRFKESSIWFGKQVKKDVSFQSYVFYYWMDGKKVSGLATFPIKEGTYPVIVMFRGFVPKEIYTIGEGTRHSAEVFAQNGFITLSPDFLGYGESDNPSSNSIEERFQTYTTGLTLLASLQGLNTSLVTLPTRLEADTTHTFLWGHSNGGHIVLSVLAITGKPYPTVLWAPVTKPFPYSILYFTDEFDDHGKALRRVVAEFEKEYDIEKYSPTNFISWITAPIQLHQGTADEAVPLRWSDQLEKDLKTHKNEIDYFIYNGEDHNFANGSWSTVVNRSVSFYKKYLQ